MKTIRLFITLLIILTAVPVYAFAAYNTDGAGLGGDTVSELPAPTAQMGITKMTLTNSLDLSDNADIDDGAAIEEAIGKIGYGCALYLPRGTYNLSRVINLKSGKSIVGDGDNTVLKVKDGTTGAAIKGDNVAGCVVEDLVITTDWTGRYPTSTANKNPDAGQMKYGVLLYSAERTAVRNLKIEKFNTAGIAVCSGNNCRFEGNTISNATELSEGGHGYGILLQDRNENNNGVTKCVIEGNSLTGPYLRHGVLLQAFSNHNEIKNNRFDNIRLDAVDLHGEGEHHNEIAYNKIYGGGESGVGAGNGPVGTHGAAGDYNYIHHNEIDGSVYGVTVMLGTQNTIIAENTFFSAEKTGIRMRYSDSTVISGNKFINMPSALLFQRETEDMGSSVHTVFDNNTAENVENVCVIEKDAAEDEMFSEISDNGGAEDRFISIIPADDSSFGIIAGYHNSLLAGIGEGVGENAVLSLRAYDKIVYFQWDIKMLSPKRQCVVLYNATNK